MGLNEKWVPGFGEVFTWFAMDKFGRIAVMLNNCYGAIPEVLLRLEEVEWVLDSISEFVWQESQEYSDYPPAKQGGFAVDLYSAWRWQEKSKASVASALQNDLEERLNYSEANLASNKGLFVYHAVEGSRAGEDYPEGYAGDTAMGDYFRFLVPGEYATLEDFPVGLRRGLVVSDSLDFSLLQVLESRLVSQHFCSLYRA